MNSALVAATIMILSPLVFLYAKFLFPYLILAPFYSLPLLVLLKRQDIGTFSVVFQILALLTTVGFVFQKGFKLMPTTPGVIALGLLSILCLYGLLIPQTHATPTIVKIIACKSILLPVVISTILSRVLDENALVRLIKLSFYVCVISSVAGILELKLGVAKLTSLGLPYGANGQIREFQTGRVRAIGLSLTNFEFSLFSGLIAIIAYTIIANYFFIERISKSFAIITFFASLMNMYTSITRQGILFPLIAITIMELFKRRNAVRIFSQIYLSMIVSFLLIVLNNLFLSESSLNGRFSLWQKLLDQNAKFIGNGIGFCGGATTSSFAKNISQIFVDNYYISIFLQVGILGLVFYLAALTSYFYQSNVFGKAILIAILFTSLVTEFWEYTSVVTIALTLIVSVGTREYNSQSSLSQVKVQQT